MRWQSIGLCFPFVTLITAFANLFGLGGAPLCAMARGKGNREGAQGIMVNAGFMLLLSGAVLTVLGIAFHRPLLYLFGASEGDVPVCVLVHRDLLDRYAVRHAVARSQSVHQLSGLCPNRHAHRGARRGSQHRARPDFYLRTAPRRARRCYRDCAVAASVCCMGCQVFNRQKAELKLDFRGFRPDWHCIQRITVLGIASFVMSFTDTLVQVACNATLRNFGGDLYISVMTVLNSVRQIAQTPVLAIADGASTAISYNYGARLYRRTRDAIRFMTQIAIGYTMLVWILVSLFPALFIRIFNQDAELVAAAVPALHIYFSAL